MTPSPLISAIINPSKSSQNLLGLSDSKVLLNMLNLCTLSGKRLCENRITDLKTLGTFAVEIIPSYFYEIITEKGEFG